jgi:hypothetical protein
MPEKGPCQGNYQRWYFNSKSGVCEKFSYGGCLKNANNFQNENECVNSCVKPKQEGRIFILTGFQFTTYIFQRFVYYQQLSEIVRKNKISGLMISKLVNVKFSNIADAMVSVPFSFFQLAFK